MNLSELASSYNLEIKSIRKKVRMIEPKFNIFSEDCFNKEIFHTESYNVLDIEVPEVVFKNLLDTVQEWTDLLEDPETRQLLIQARFLLRLKKGNI